MEKANFSTKEASSYFNKNGVEFTPATLTLWRSQGKGPRYKKIAWKVYYERQDLDEFMLGEKSETVDTIEAGRGHKKYKLKLQ